MSKYAFFFNIRSYSPKVRKISNIFFIDTEQLSKMLISSQVFFKDFADKVQNSYLPKSWIMSEVFLKDFDHKILKLLRQKQFI